MSLRPDLTGPVPKETVRIAQAVFRKGNIYLRLLNELWIDQTREALRSLPAVQGLRKTWIQQFFWHELAAR